MEAPLPLIIPGLPNGIAMLCLLKVPRVYHSCLASVCVTWRNVVRHPEFYCERRRLGSTDAWLILLSAEIVSTPTLLYSVYDLSTRQLLFQVKFPPSLQPDALDGCSTDTVKAARPACCIDHPLCSIGFMGGSIGKHTNAASYNAKCAEHRLSKDAVGGKMCPDKLSNMSRNAAAMNCRFEIDGSGACAEFKAPGRSISPNFTGNRKDNTNSNIIMNPAYDAECGHCAASTTEVCSTRLHNLDHYRIVAMNECFAVLGFIQRSRLRAAISTLTIYNTVTNKWRHRRPPSICREMFACGLIEGQLYVAGGWNEEGEMERTTEVYNFHADKWGTAEALPEGIRRIQGDAVYKGKLYVQCWEEGRCVIWVYNPEEDEWQKLQNGMEVGAQQLVATDNYLYAMGGSAEGEMLRYEGSNGKWRNIGRKRALNKMAAGSNPSKVRPGPAECKRSSQNAFGHGDEIFVLQESNGAAAPCGLQRDGVTRCHRLLSVKASWYHAGAVVDT